MLTLFRIIVGALLSLASIGAACVLIFTHGGGVALAAFLGGQCVAAFIMPDV